MVFGWVAACGVGLALLPAIPAVASGQEQATIHASVTVMSDGAAEVLAETERQIAEFCCAEPSSTSDQLRMVVESGVAMVYANRELVESRPGNPFEESQSVQTAAWADAPPTYVRITVAYVVN